MMTSTRRQRCKKWEIREIYLCYFLVGANFWAILAILGHFWAILGNFDSFLGYFGPFFGANFFVQKFYLCYFYYFLHLCEEVEEKVDDEVGKVEEKVEKEEVGR